MVQVGKRTAQRSKRRHFQCLVVQRVPQHSISGSRKTEEPGRFSSNVTAGLASSAALRAVGEKLSTWREASLRAYWGFWQTAIPGPVTAGGKFSGVIPRQVMFLEDVP